MLLLVSAVLAAPVLEGVRPAANPLDSAFDAAAGEFGVPKALLMAIGWEATRWNPDAVSAWGGWGMYDLREGDMDPSLEHAARLLEMDPNVVGTDWRQSIRGAAAILADQARLANGGRLPAADDLGSWGDAVKAFSGREEPIHQQLYVRAIYQIAGQGALADTRWGTVIVPPQDVVVPAAPVAPPAGDSSVVDQFYAACTDNYSEEYSRGSGDIDMVVVHTVQGSYSGCASWFANCSAGASAHYVVRSSDGAVTQMVYEADIAWHAGNWDYNERSVGIEHEGYIDDPGTWYTDAMYAGSAALVADIASRQGVSLSRSYIIGHDEVPDPDGSGWGGAGHHTDPGDGWDWDYFMGLLNGETGTTGGEILGVVRDSDIYNGADLVGATAWIAETGETTTVGSDGYYRFEEVPFGTYTIYAEADGYLQGSCGPKEHGSEQSWCSIALTPDGGGTDDTGEDPTTDTAEETDEDSGEVDTGPAATERPVLPGNPVRMAETGALCATGATGPTPAGAWASIGLLALLLRRRR